MAKARMAARRAGRAKPVRKDAAVAATGAKTVAKGAEPKAGLALLAWYDTNRRALPWRAEPGETTDPYSVWLSEIMLQQTTVAAVIPYYQAFLRRWPTVQDLAAAKDEDVMAAWAGLGYYARARNLLAAARAVSAAGAFPTTAEALRKLPGIGAYTSAAVAAIAFGQPIAAVDGNVERVVARLTALEVSPKKAQRQVTDAVTAIMVRARPGDFAQAMMDLGAVMCTPRNPSCGRCPLNDGCRAYGEGRVDQFPVRTAKAAKANWQGVAFVVRRADGAILLRRRPDKGLLGGMAEVFGSPWGDPPTEPLAHAPLSANWQEAGAVRHIFTHAELTLTVFAANVRTSAATPTGGYWQAPEAAGLPTAIKKAVVRGLAMLEATSDDTTAPKAIRATSRKARAR